MGGARSIAFAQPLSLICTLFSDSARDGGSRVRVRVRVRASLDFVRRVSWAAVSLTLTLTLTLTTGGPVSFAEKLCTFAAIEQVTLTLTLTPCACP